LCVYCHDNEHSRYLDSAGRSPGADTLAAATHNPFAALADLVKKRG
jgi:hypothetical protein